MLNWSRYIFAIMVAVGCCYCTSDVHPEQDLASYSIPEVPSFNFDIRPILSNNCYLCHGPDVSTREAELRLDLEGGLTAKLERGRQVIVPGNAGKSELYKRIRSHDPDFVMPPPVTKRELSGREVAMIERWIEQGAQWEPYWAFIPPTSKEVPDVSSNTGNEIDAFLLRELEESNLEISEKASAAALIRRLSYVLCGLPPQALNIVVPDGALSKKEYESIVDQLLASPHFGERWARHWMDLTRYAEGKGHEFDYPVKGAWHYRDYLIRAFNDDLPYDQFVREHIAGDMVQARIHPETGHNESLLATIHYRMSEGKHSPVDIKEEESDRIDNIIDVTTKTFQALTVSCAQCHDHKFDPIATAEYYALYGIFESTRQVVHAKSNLEEVRSTDEKVEQLRKVLRDEGSGWLKQILNEPGALSIAHQGHSADRKDIGVDVIGDFSTGDFNDWQSQGSVINELGEFSGGTQPQLRLGGLTNRYAAGTLASVRSPTFILEKDSIVVRAAGKNATIRLVIDNFQLIQNPIYGELELKLDHEEYTYFLIPVKPWLGHKAYLEVHSGQYHRQKIKVDEEAFFVISYAAAFDSTRPAAHALRTELKNPQEAYERWRKGKANQLDVASLNKELNDRPIKVSNLSTPRSVASPIADSLLFYGVAEGDHVRSPVFIRGSHTQLAEEGEPHRFLAAIDDEEYGQDGSNRLDLAATLTSKENPLTARVMVNRLWHHIFGRGLVETVDNFGLQGKAPTHPDLLDFLAVEFMNSGWSIKSMIKSMVMSDAFKRSTKTSPENQNVDPQNLLLSHYPIRRLEAEAIRDAVLACSGTLDLQMYGPSVPLHLDEFLRGRGRPTESGPIDGRGRRSLYQAIPRNFLPPMMLTYDMPAPFSTFGRRNLSNVPAQSLTMMNDPFILQETQRWADLIIEKGGSFHEQVTMAYQWAFTRSPEEKELTEARDFFKEQKVLYESSAHGLPSEHQTWSDFLHTLILMKEFIFLI